MTHSNTLLTYNKKWTGESGYSQDKILTLERSKKTKNKKLTHPQ